MTNCNNNMNAPLLADALLAWYDANARELPWRSKPGEFAEPYHVWLSEIMLQQTTVITVVPYFQAFLKRWPSVTALADAPLDEVLHAWQGLGYYARARNLHKCAGIVAREHHGRFPDTEDFLKVLPGIGPYTAAAIAAIAFGRKASPVDGNIERVMARIHLVTEPLPAAKPKLKALAESLTPEKRAGDFAQALMDLGATICKPKSAECTACPWRENCKATNESDPTLYPKRAPKKKKPTRYGIAYYLTNGEGALLLRRRAEKGLLGGMMEVPSSDWRETRWKEAEALKHAPASLPWSALPGTVRHTFTHFHLELSVFIGQTDQQNLDGVWVRGEDLPSQALPTVMKKIIAHGANWKG